MIVAGFYTNDTYKAKAQAMAASVESFGLECILFSLEDTGSWTRNVNYKPSVVSAALVAAQGDSVLYLDADAKMVQKPSLLPCDADFAAYYESPTRPCGGSLWFRSEKRCKKLVENWAKRVADNPECADDWVNLSFSLRENKTTPLHLPPSYNWHESTMRCRFPGADPVIVHECGGEHSYKVY